MRILALVTAGVMTVGALTATPVAQQRAAAEDPADVKALLFELANTIGMLRSLQQEDSIITLEHWAKGTMTVGQQKYEVPEYRLSINYAVPGARLDYVRQAPGGQAQRIIGVVSGNAAWNETQRGRGATPAPDRVKERLVHLWTTPMGVVKAAGMAGAKATMKSAGADTMLSFPLPAPAEDVIVTATVRRDASLLARPNPEPLEELVGTYIIRVQTSGGVASDTTYAEYGDWNWDDYKADIFLPRRIVRKQGDTTLELMTVNTNTYNPYVVMPVPDNVK